jgi:hypothetical protein
MKTFQISSSWTLFLKLVVPILWTTVFGLFAIASLVTSNINIGDLPITSFRIGNIFFFLLGLWVIYKTVYKLKRVDMDGEYAYITNYLKNIRYPIQDIEKLEIGARLLFFYNSTIILKGEGSFGSRIPFVLSKRKLNRFLAAHPQLELRIEN